MPNNERKLPYYVCYTTTGGWLVGWLLLYLRFFVGGEYQPTSQTSTAIKTSRIFADVTANYSFPSFRCCVYVQSAKGKLLHVDWYNPTFLILLLITGMSHTHHIVSEKIEGFHHQENCCYQSSCCWMMGSSIKQRQPTTYITGVAIIKTTFEKNVNSTSINGAKEQPEAGTPSHQANRLPLQYCNLETTTE